MSDTSFRWETAAVAKLYQVPAAIASGETTGAFTLVTAPSAGPFVSAHADDDYTILVGFDSSAKPAAELAAKGRRSHAKPPQG